MEEKKSAAVIDQKVEEDRRQIKEAQKKGLGAKIGTYTRLSGPGWLQSAITLGGGSLAGSLYLGIIAGVSLLWIQPLAMILGIIMLSAIGYVTLSTGERPFRAINRHINPVLGWSWAIAALLANFVWCLPQYALGAAALRQNLFPELLGGEGGLVVATAILFVVAGIVIWFYNSGSRGIKIFETILKLMIAVIVLSFFGVVFRMAFAGDLDWGAIFSGFVPDFRLMFEPAHSLRGLLADTGSAEAFWAAHVVAEQRDVILAAVATAVGINMTFLLPYSMLARGWDRDFRGLATFDLSTGLFVPFLLATSCVIIASATQFHAQPSEALLPAIEQNEIEEELADSGLYHQYEGFLRQRLENEIGAEAFAALDDTERAERVAALPVADRHMAATLVTRDAFDLATSLERLTGSFFAQVVFGVGVLGMALSTMIVLALINGFVVCEMLNLPSKGTPHRIGSYLCLAVGALGPFIWAGAAFYLAVPTSVFGMMLIPIAYIAFFLMMNQKKMLGGYLPTGGRRVVWNILMGIAVTLATLSAGWAIGTRTGPFPFIGLQQRWVAVIVIVLLTVLGLVIHFVRKAREAKSG